LAARFIPRTMMADSFLHKRRVSSEFRKRRMLLPVLVWPVARRLTHETA
jgi:hypothetical protein